MADRMIKSLMTSLDHESQGRDPNIFKALYLKNGSR